MKGKEEMEKKELETKERRDTTPTKQANNLSHKNKSLSLVLNTRNDLKQHCARLVQYSSHMHHLG